MDGRPRPPSTRMPRRPGELPPRAPHRSGLDTLASSGSCHRTKAAAFRRELELLLLPVGSLPTAMTRSLRSTGITPLHGYKETDSPPQLDSDEAAMTYERFIRCGSAKPVANYYEAVRPSPAHQYFRPRLNVPPVDTSVQRRPQSSPTSRKVR